MIDLHLGDCLDVLKTLADNSVDSCVTDPPYHLTSIVKRFGGKNAAPAKFGTDGAFARASRGFMNQTWDGGDIAFQPELWAEVLRVLKPGAHLLAFSGTRTYHRMAVAIEDAGFEIRDQMGWTYVSGFPKSHSVPRAIDSQQGVPARGKSFNMKGKGDRADELDGNGRVVLPAYEGCTPAARRWQGWGSALKPAWEPICVARKPLAGTIAENVLTYGTGALNIDGCRVPHDGTGSWGDGNGSRPAGFGDVGADKGGTEPCGQRHEAGRWPANLIHDGSDEVVDVLKGAARFFYCPKASKRDRDEGLEGFAQGSNMRVNAPRRDENEKASTLRANTHPTVKPTKLMAYLCRLVTPPGGIVLDPFMGSGSTGKAAVAEGLRFLGIEREFGYFEIALARISNSAG